MYIAVTNLKSNKYYLVQDTETWTISSNNLSADTHARLVLRSKSSVAASSANILNDHATGVELDVETLLVLAVAEEAGIKVVTASIAAQRGTAGASLGIGDAVAVLGHAVDVVEVSRDGASAGAAAAGGGGLNALHEDVDVGDDGVGARGNEEGDTRELHCGRCRV